MKGIFKVLSIFFLTFIIVGCGNTSFDCEKNEYKKNPVATIKVKDYGTMKFELFVNKAPQTVASFTSLANDGFYNGLSIHRIDEGLGIIQGGDPAGNGTSGPGYNIKGEFEANGHCNTMQNEEGTIAMARSSDYDSAGSQFFFNFKNNTKVFYGENQYAVFGKIIEGEDVLQKLGGAKTNATMPTPAITIESIKVDTFNQEMPEFEKLNKMQ